MRLPCSLVLGQTFPISIFPISFLPISILPISIIPVSILPISGPPICLHRPSHGDRASACAEGRRHLTMAEIEALPNSFPIALRPPTSPTLRPMYTRLVELGEKFSPSTSDSCSARCCTSSRCAPRSSSSSAGPQGSTARQNHIRVCYELIPEVNQLLPASREPSGSRSTPRRAPS